MKILIVDDEESVAKSLQRILTMLGHESGYCTSAADGVKQLEKEAYDFILLDYLMPENTGIWFMRNARIPDSTKVLLITAFVNRNVIEEMLRLGACGYLIKPFDEDEIEMHLNFHANK